MSHKFSCCHALYLIMPNPSSHSIINTICYTCESPYHIFICLEISLCKSLIIIFTMLLCFELFILQACSYKIFLTSWHHLHVRDCIRASFSYSPHSSKHNSWCLVTPHHSSSSQLVTLF